MGNSIDTPYLFLVEIIGALAPALSIGMPFKPDLKERSSDTVYLTMFERYALWLFDSIFYIDSVGAMLL